MLAEVSPVEDLVAVDPIAHTSLDSLLSGAFIEVVPLSLFQQLSHLSDWVPTAWCRTPAVAANAD
jgi:hypothetical protein